MNETDHCLLNASLLCHAADDELRQVASRYPWFSLANLLLAHRTGSQDAAVELVRSARLAAGIPLDQDAFAQQQDLTLSAIEQFLNKGEHRIVPDETTPDDDLSVLTSAKEDEDEPITEELAEIYRMQGLYIQAREVYERLCLLYPKKSVYFAEIIAKLDRQIKNNNKQ